MSRPRRVSKNAFARALDALEVTYRQAATDLDLRGPTYVGMIARGDVRPSLKLARRIRDWAHARGQRVPLTTFFPDL